MKIKLNDQTYETKAHHIESLINELGLDAKRIVVLVNEEPIEKSNWKNVEIYEQIKLDLLEFVGGG